MPSHEPTPLRRIRKAHGLSLEALAYRAGVSTATVWRAEVGRHKTAEETWTALADALGVDVAALHEQNGDTREDPGTEIAEVA